MSTWLHANDHRTEPDRSGTLLEIVTRRAIEQPNDLAFVYLADGAAESARLTFGELDAEARRIAHILLEHARSGDRALLVYEPGLDFIVGFLGCLYAGVVGVPLPAPELSRLQRGLPRLRAVAKDCGARLLLGNARTHGLLHDVTSGRERLDQETWIDTSDKTKVSTRQPSLPSIDSRSLAYLQYTSGSTSRPKGVMVTHANLVVNLAAIQVGCSYDGSSVTVGWMPHFHDYGLVEGILEPLFNGTPAYLLSPFAFVKRPVRWLEAISRYRATHTQAPNFAYSHCLRRVTEDQRRSLDLRSLKSAGNGAEPVHPATLEEFMTVFGLCGFRREAMSPAYGLAEATLMVTASPADEAPVARWFDVDALSRDQVLQADPGASSRCLVASGRPLPGVTVAIVDPETRRQLGIGKVGEIWLAGDSMGEGYWQLPLDTQETFEAQIIDSDGQRYLRTGDLGFLHEGHLFIGSRLKDLIIVRGLNHHPQDIEWTAQESSPALRPGNGAAFSVETGGEDAVVLVQELERMSEPIKESDLDYGSIAAGIVQAVADVYEISLHAVVLIKRGTLPKTSSGKVQRRACCRAFLDNTLQVLWTWTVGFDLRKITDNTLTLSMPGAGTPAAAGGKTTDDLIQWLREYAEQRINSRLIDERRCVPPSIIMDFGNRGIFGLQVPRDHQGLGLTQRDAARVLQQLGAIDLTLAMMVLLHNTNGILPILRYGSDSVRSQFLPLLATGRELGAFALSEPPAGSNLGKLETRFVRDGSSWLIHGTKRWNGSAWAGVTNVFARESDANGRLGKLTGFVVRRTDQGLRIGPEALTMGMRGIMQNTLRLEGVRVGPDQVLGEVGQGMTIVEDVLASSRLATGAVALGGAKRCAQLMLRYATRRDIETGKLLDNPQAAIRISDLLHRIDVADELLNACAADIDCRKPLSPDLAMALKVLATETLNSAADLLVQLLGGRGYMENNIAPQIFRDARVLSIGEGPNEGLLAGMGRSFRFKDRLSDFFHEDVADRLIQGKAAVEQHVVSPGPYPGSSLRVWQDAVLGRLVLAALELSAALRIADRRDSAAIVRWAEMRFETSQTDIARGCPAIAAALGTDQIRRDIQDYRGSIGDVEPLAPDVEWALDPLLRRDAPAEPNLAEKRDLLRRMLEKEKRKERQ